MTITSTEHSQSTASTEPSELLIKEAREASRRRRLRWASFFSVLAAVCLIAIGVGHNTSSPTRLRSAGQEPLSSATPCTSALVKLLGLSPIPGGSGHAGFLVRVAVTAPSACIMSGYPKVGEELSNGSNATAGEMRLGYLGGFAKADAPLPRLSITSRSREVSFTLQMPGCNGPRPMDNAIRITLPGEPGALTSRSIYESGFGVIKGFGLYCGKPFVTPLVKGSTGDFDWR
jgi:hypothetical protein